MSLWSSRSTALRSRPGGGLERANPLVRLGLELAERDDLPAPSSSGAAVALVLAFEVPAQVLLSGAMRGFGIGVFAVGIILIFRSCKVINFALGELGALCAAVFVRLVVNWHWNFYLALLFTMAGGALLGALLELAIVRRLFRAPRVVLLAPSAPPSCCCSSSSRCPTSRRTARSPPPSRSSGRSTT